MGWNGYAAAAGAIALLVTLVVAAPSMRGGEERSGDAAPAAGEPAFAALPGDAGDPPSGGSAAGDPAAGDVAASAELAPDAELIVLGDSLSDIGNAAAIVDFLLGGPVYPEPEIGLCNPIERLLLGRDCADILHGRTRIT